MAKKILSLENPLVKHLIRLKKNHDYRIEHQSLLIEGKNLIEEIYEKCSIKNLIVSDLDLLNENMKKFKELTIVSTQVMQKISGVLSPEGIIAEIEYPQFKPLKNKKRILVLDGVSDPGNLGTLLRSAFAFNWEAVFLLPNCCDPFNDKALRAAKGATFFLSLQFGSIDDLTFFIKDEKLTVLGADMSGMPFQEIKNEEALVLILGNEANGLSEDSIKISKLISIPMENNFESLNVAVAGGILMYHFNKRRK